jgi:ribosome recycling factor
MAQGFAENSRIGIRASRKEAMDALKIAQKDGYPEDDVKRAEKDVQKNTDDAVAKSTMPYLQKSQILEKSKCSILNIC